MERGAAHRAVDTLRRAGHLRARTPISQLARAALLAAAGIVLFIGGVRWGQNSQGSEASYRFALFLLEDSTFLGTRTVGHDSLVAEYSAWAGSLARAGQLDLGEELDHRAWSLGNAASDSPAGRITGLFVLSAPSEEAALAIARSCPHLRYGGGIVVRPIRSTPSS